MVEIEKPDEKRKFERVRFAEALEFQEKTSQLMGGCLGCDLSEGGIKIHFNEFIPINTEIDLTLKLKNRPGVVTVSGKVVWVSQVAFSDRYLLGLEFTGKDPDSKLDIGREIHNYIKSHQN